MPHFLDNLKSTLRDGIKASGSLFAGGGSGTGVSANVGYMGANWSSNPFRLSAGSKINWDTVTGGIQENPVAATCLSIISENYVQARIRVEKRVTGEDKYEPDASHPLLPLFKNPNPFYSWDYLTKGIIASLHGTGDAYIGVERDGRGKPSELYWLPYGVTPRKNPGSKNLWDGWNYTVGRDTRQVDTEDIIHIPFGANPARPGFGLSGWQALKQDVYTLQQAANYTANVMRNNGTVGVLLTPKTIKDGNNNIVQPDIDPKAVVDNWRAKTRGDNAGDANYIDFPLDVTFPKNSPEDLALGEMLARPECNICAVFRVSILLVGAKGGDGAKTYANYGEARSSLWEECIIPLEHIIASELTTQLLPQMGGNPVTQRVSYDTSGIRALQPDADALNKRYLDSFLASAITRADYKRGTRQEVRPEDEGVYAWMLPKVTDTGQVSGGQVTQGLDNAGHDVGVLQDRQDANQQARGNALKPAVQPPVVTGGRSPVMLTAGKSAAYKSDDGEWITVNGNHVHIGSDGKPDGNSPASVALREKETGSSKESVQNKEKNPEPSAKSILAKQSAVRVAGDIQRYSEEHNEPKLAAAVNGKNLKDNEPVDVEVRGKNGVLEHGIEMKTKTVGAGDQVFMKKDAQARKAAYQEQTNAHFHTVVYDDKKVYNAKGEGQHDESKRVMYYKRGYGSFSVPAMHVVNDHAELNRLLNTPTADLPKAAQPPKSYREPVK